MNLFLKCELRLKTRRGIKEISNYQKRGQGVVKFQLLRTLKGRLVIKRGACIHTQIFGVLEATTRKYAFLAELFEFNPDFFQRNWLLGRLETSHQANTTPKF